MSADAAHDGAMFKSLQKNEAHSTNASNSTEFTHGMAASAAPAKTRPIAPLKRLPHFRLPQRFEIQSDKYPPTKHEIMPTASGMLLSWETTSSESSRVFRK